MVRIVLWTMEGILELASLEYLVFGCLFRPCLIFFGIRVSKCLYSSESESEMAEREYSEEFSEEFSAVGLEFDVVWT